MNVAQYTANCFDLFQDISKSSNLTEFQLARDEGNRRQSV